MNDLAIFQKTSEVSKPDFIKASMMGAQDVRFVGGKGEGFFQFDGVNSGETEITMQILAIIPIKCEDFYLFNEDFKKYDRWLELVFLDENQKLSSMFVKMESMGRLETVVRALDLDDKPYPTQIIKAKAAARDNPRPHFVLEFEHIGPAAPEVIKAIEGMIESKSPYLMAASRYLNGKVKTIERTDSNAA